MKFLVENNNHGSEPLFFIYNTQENSLVADNIRFDQIEEEVNAQVEPSDVEFLMVGMHWDVQFDLKIKLSDSPKFTMID